MLKSFMKCGKNTTALDGRSRKFYNGPMNKETCRESAPIYRLLLRFKTFNMFSSFSLGKKKFIRLKKTLLKPVRVCSYSFPAKSPDYPTLPNPLLNFRPIELQPEFKIISYFQQNTYMIHTCMYII